jgi:hypothetical protein
MSILESLLLTLMLVGWLMLQGLYTLQVLRGIGLS